MRLLKLRRAAMICAGTVLMASGAMAQAPPPVYPVAPPGVVPVAPASPEAAEIAACLCLRRAIDTLGADMATRQHSYDEVRGELSRLDAQLEQERSGIDVNNPASVGRFRQLLQQRDVVFRRSTGPISSDLSGVVERYNARVNEYNARCANRPQNPALVAGVQATLSCPPP